MARRDVSWQFIDKSGDVETRQLADGPASSYEEDEDMDLGFSDHGAHQKHAALLYAGPDDHEDILHPLREAANRVGREVERFAEVLDGYNPHRAVDQEERHDLILDLIDLYCDISAETLARLRERHSADRNDDTAEATDDAESALALHQTTVADMDRWEQETHTWDLLRRLVNLRFPRSVQREDQVFDAPLHPHASEKEAWTAFLDSDDLALERQTVLQWLKDTASESREDIDDLVRKSQQDAEKGTIAQGWIYTLQAIKHQKRVHGWHHPLDPSSPDVQRVHLSKDSIQSLVTQLDPDAPSRQNRSLERKDEYYERAIWLGCFELLRRGNSLSETREWCHDRTEAWRAVSMSGFPGDYESDDDDVGDPASFTLWRKMCFAAARQAGGSEYQRAVYGILSGDIESVEPVCQSWNDFVFVHYNALLRCQFDNFLQSGRSLGSNSISDASVFDAVQFYGEPTNAGKSLIERLKADSRTLEETLEPMKMLQGVLIANKFKDFIYQQGLALTKSANADKPSSLFPVTQEQPRDEHTGHYIAMDDHDGLRVLAHTLIILKNLGMDLGGFAKEVEVENVIVAYISFLRLAGKEELIPLYSSQLSGARKYAVLSRNLIDVTDHEQRSTQIKLMRELGLDVQHFVKMQSRFLFDDYHDDCPHYPANGAFKLFLEGDLSINSSNWKLRRDFLGEDDENPERSDMLLIRSLEWYLLVDGLWSEIFNVGTMLYMRFYKHMHLLSARILASRVTTDQIARSKTRAFLGESIGLYTLMAEDGDLSERLDGAVDSKQLLKKHLYNEAKSFRELECLAEHLDNVETISSHATLLQETGFAMPHNYKQELARMFPSIQTTAQSLLNGWLVTSQKQLTEAEFQQLREAYLPDAIMAYIEILQFAGITLSRDFLLEVMNMSTILAQEDSDLLELFNKTGRMQDLVTSFARASKSLLVVSSERKHGGGPTRKMKLKGWNHDLWSVRAS